ncbi:MAG: hypothetical protein OSA43_10320, partial [Pirellulales bacterium]|nr:hypothetical protein [Pirellulales bacterium]
MTLTAPTGGILGPTEPELRGLAQNLSAHAGRLDQSGEWPVYQLKQCGESGVFRWFVPPKMGGLGWSETDILRGYLRL